MFTTRHYIAVAKVIAGLPGTADGRHTTASHFARMFEADSPRFDRMAFMAECALMRRIVSLDRDE